MSTLPRATSQDDHLTALGKGARGRNVRGLHQTVYQDDAGLDAGRCMCGEVFGSLILEHGSLVLPRSS